MKHCTLLCKKENPVILFFSIISIQFEIAQLKILLALESMVHDSFFFATGLRVGTLSQIASTACR